jgi:hypothetical protein
MLAYFSYVALKFRVALMHDRVKSYFWAPSRLEASGKAPSSSRRRATEFPRRCPHVRKLIRGRFDALLSASQHGARQTRIGPLDPPRAGWPPRLSRRSPWSSGCDARNRPHQRQASVAVDRRRGHAPVRIVRHGEFGGAAEVPQNPAAKLRKSQSPRRVDASRYPLPEGSLPHRKKRFAEPGIDDRRIKKSTQFKHEKMRKFSVIDVSSL